MDRPLDSLDAVLALVRVHVLLGDYTLALSMLDHIELDKKALLTRARARGPKSTRGGGTAGSSRTRRRRPCPVDRHVCYSVLNVLYSLIQKSKILDQLAAAQKGEDVE
jgi:hypothetical protein